jgi:hypothetical protein
LVIDVITDVSGGAAVKTLMLSDPAAVRTPNWTSPAQGGKNIAMEVSLQAEICSGVSPGSSITEQVEQRCPNPVPASVTDPPEATVFAALVASGPADSNTGDGLQRSTL